MTSTGEGQGDNVAKMIGPEDWKRIVAVSEKRSAAETAVDDARHAWAETKTDDARELWRLALLEQERADAEYWSVTGEYFERLSPR